METFDILYEINAPFEAIFFFPMSSQAYFRHGSIVFIQSKMSEDDNYAVGRLGTEALVTTHLAKQSLENLDVTKLTPLSPEVISRQATINIGMFSSSKLIKSPHPHHVVGLQKKILDSYPEAAFCSIDV
jgi:hypothetical protein